MEKYRKGKTGLKKDWLEEERGPAECGAASSGAKGDEMKKEERRRHFVEQR